MSCPWPLDQCSYVIHQNERRKTWKIRSRLSNWSLSDSWHPDFTSQSHNLSSRHNGWVCIHIASAACQSVLECAITDWFLSVLATPTHHHGRSCLRLRVYVCCSTGTALRLHLRLLTIHLFYFFVPLIHLSIYLSIHRSTHLSIHQSLLLCINPLTFLLFHPSFRHPSIDLSTNLIFFSSIHLSILPCIYQASLYPAIIYLLFLLSIPSLIYLPLLPCHPFSTITLFPFIFQYPSVPFHPFFPFPPISPSSQHISNAFIIPCI